MKTPDFFKPDPVIHCPICGTPLGQWKSAEGPGRGLLWQEHAPQPALDLVPEPTPQEAAQLQALRLQDDLHIETTCPHCFDGALYVQARCTVRDALWQDTAISEVRDRQSGRVFYSLYD